MAEKKEPEILEEEEQQLVEESPGEKSGGLFRLLIFLLPMILLPTTAGAYLAYYQYPALAHAYAVVAVRLDFGSNEEEVTKKPIKYGEFHTITDLLVNPAGSGGNNILMATLSMETMKGDVISELDSKSIVIRDALLKILGERTVNELADISYRQEIKDSLLNTVNGLLSKGEVERLYFTEYILR